MGAEARPGYRPEIDGLRAVAVIAVVASHMNHELVPGGFLGVDVFFVISGYVITASLAHRASSSVGRFLLGFYERRIKRLTPALVCCVIITAVALCLFDPTPASYLKTGQTALFGFSNVALYRNSLNYFGHGAELDTFTQTWSLGVEEQFYFLYPILAWVSGFGRGVKRGRARLAVLVVGLAGVSLFWFVHWHRTSFEASYFLMPSRFWELAAGCLLCLMQEEVDSTVAVFRDGAWQLDTMWILLPMCFLFFSPAELRVPATITEVVLTCVFIATASPGTAGYIALTQKPMMYFGRVSYSLYLWHWPVISISRRTNLAPRRGGWTALAHIPIMLLLSHASYACIEKPFRHAVWSSRQGLSLLYGLIAMSAALGFLVWLEKSPGAADALYLDEPCTPGLKETCTTPNSVHMEIFPHISGSEITPQTCFLHLRYNGLKEDTIPRCIRRTEKSSQKIFVYGDSYAANLGGLVNSLVDTHPMELHYLPIEGCDYDGTAKIFPHEPEHPDRWHWQCNEINEQRRKHLRANVGPRDIVVLSSRRYSWEIFPDGDVQNVGRITTSDPKALPTKQAFPEEVKSMLRTEVELAKKGGYFLVFHTPIPQINPPAQQQWFLKHLGCALPGECARLCRKVAWFAQKANGKTRGVCDHVWTEGMAVLEERGRKQAAGDFFKELKRDFPENVFIWNLDDLLCEKRGGTTVCSTHDTSGRYYADWGGHLSLYSSEKFSSAFIQFFEMNSLIGGMEKGKGSGDKGKDGEDKGKGGGNKGKGGEDKGKGGGNKGKGGEDKGKGGGDKGKGGEDKGKGGGDKGGGGGDKGKGDRDKGNKTGGGAKAQRGNKAKGGAKAGKGTA